MFGNIKHRISLSKNLDFSVIQDEFKKIKTMQIITYIILFYCLFFFNCDITLCMLLPLISRTATALISVDSISIFKKEIQIT